MKRFILLIITLLPATLFAQSINFDDMISEYSTKKGCTAITVSNVMLETMGVGVGAENLSAISVENSELLPRFNEQIAELVKGMEVMMTVNHDGQCVNIYLTRQNDVVRQIVIVTSDSDKCILMTLWGNNLELQMVNSFINNK